MHVSVPLSFSLLFNFFMLVLFLFHKREPGLTLSWKGGGGGGVH